MSTPDTFYPPRRLQQPVMPPTPFAWAALTPDEEPLYLEGLELWGGSPSATTSTTASCHPAGANTPN